MEIKAVVVAGQRVCCAGDRSSAANPLTGFYSELQRWLVGKQLMAGVMLPAPAGPQG